MTEEEAQNWLRDNCDVSRETWERLEAFIAFIKREAQSQNLVAASTLDHIWARHIVDSAQLLRLIPSKKIAPWLDLGAGAGFPGIVTAILSPRRTTLVESRNKRIEYLNRAVEMLDMTNIIQVVGRPVEKLQSTEFAVISARAFAPLPKLMELAARFSTKNTIWLLPKGRNAAKELDECSANWNMDFEIKPSVTDDEAGIIVGTLLDNIPKSL